MSDTNPISPEPSNPVVPAGESATGSVITNRSSATGCLPWTLMLLAAGGVFLLSQAVQALSTFQEQAIFEGSLDIPDFRWVYVLIFALVVAIPTWALFKFYKANPVGAFFRAFALAGVFALLQAPSRLVGLTNALGTAVLQIVGMLVFLVLLAVSDRKQARLRPTMEGVGLALLVGGAVGIPWVLWGALGSFLDTFLNFIVAILFGISAALVLTRGLRPETTAEPGGSRLGMLLLEGWGAAVILMILVTGLGVNGSQGLLFTAMPVIGWAMVGVAAVSRREDGQLVVNWPALALLAGLTVFWPLAWIDPDELSWIVTLSAGELIQWANLAAFVSLGIGLVLAAVLLGLSALRLRSRMVSLLSGVGGAFIWVLLLGLYVVAGQPGLYGERLFVILKDQADLTQASQIANYQERRAAVYRTLVDHANATQSEMRGTLDTLRIPYTPYYLENAIEVQGGPLVRLWLESRPEVDRVLDSPVLRPLPAAVPVSEGFSESPTEVGWNLTMIGADKVWEEFDVRGAGVVVGQSDSGTWGEHPELADSYRGQDGSDDYNWFDPWYRSQSPTDIGGHGTHTLGSILGNHVGIAPDAHWIGCVNLGRNLGNPALYLDCMQFMLAPFPQNGDPLKDGRPDLGADVLNNSWGCPEVEGCDPNALLGAVRALRAAGIFVVASAGNEGSGGCETVASPIALYDEVYSVGAVDEFGELASFSSLGPVMADGSGRIKPDLVAPGVDVLSSYPNDTYSTASGTSMAGPHVVGAVTLLWSANPDLKGNVERTEQILNESADPFTGTMPGCGADGMPNNAAGYGVLNVYEAVKMALGK